jgi:apolipoprotein N-acyltransferase
MRSLSNSSYQRMLRHSRVFRKARPFVAVLCAIAMALAFPKANLTMLMPIGVAGLFWGWYGLTPLRAFWNGWLAGFTFLAISWSWFGQTAGAFIAPFGFVLVVVPALFHGFAFAFAGALSAIAYARAPRILAPLGAAAAFTLCEWLRSLGPFAAPFSDISYPFVETPLAPIAAYIGSIGLTFTLCVVGAYLAYALYEPRNGATARTLLAMAGTILLCTCLAWIFWPARSVAKPTYPVAAVQGNMPNIRWTQVVSNLSFDRYKKLTEEAALYDPAFILWPEAVQPVNLNTLPELQGRLSRLARSVHTELILGAQQARNGKTYNALYFFRPDGVLDAVYRKRNLVPFAETLPFWNLLGRFSGGLFLSFFSAGDASGVIDVGGERIAPIVCWESAFSDIVVNDIRAGAQAFVIATDDAWFGTTPGPYQHAQIAQMRALETGVWIVRAGSSGISGIIAPTGRYIVRTNLNETTIIHGFIGLPTGSLFSAIGATPIALALSLLYAGVVTRRSVNLRALFRKSGASKRRSDVYNST